MSNHPLLPPLSGGAIEPLGSTRPTVFTAPWRRDGGANRQDSWPAEVRQTLEAHGLWPHKILIKLLRPAAVRRSPLGAAQEVTGWWVTRHDLVAAEARRPLADLGHKRFRPAGPWEIHVEHHVLSATVVTRPTYRPPAAPAASGPGAVPAEVVVVESDDPTDLLPPELGAKVRHGEVDVSLLGGGGRIGHSAYGLCVASGRAVALYAERTARSADGSEAPLAAAPWRAVVVEAAVARTKVANFEARGDPAKRSLLARVRRRQALLRPRPGLPRPKAES